MSGRKAVARRRSRQAALQVLFAADLAERGGGGAPAAEEVFDRVSSSFDLPEGAHAFAKELVRGVSERLGEVDEVLTTHATNWRVTRMSVVDRNVLRLAVYELVHTDTPTSVVIDEAIELARRFGAEPSPAFVNGVLDAVARSVRAEGEA